MWRDHLALDPQFLQKRLEFVLELSSNVGADGADLDACGGDVFRDEFSKLTTGQVTMRQAIIWHPTANAGEAVFRNTAMPVSRTPPP